MRKTLLTTVAAAALIATAGIASAQNAQPSAEPKGGAQMKSESPGTQKSESPSMNRASGPDKAAPAANNAQAQPDAAKADRAAKTADPNAPAKDSAQSAPDPNNKGKSAAETKDSNTPSRTNAQAPGNSNNKSATDSKATTDTKSATDTKNSTSSKTSVSLSTEQRTKIRTTVLQQSNAPRVSKVDFNISIGTKVPRTAVRPVVLPTTVVEVYPQWRGFLYFIVGDEIVVVEPDTLEIVAVLSA